MPNLLPIGSVVTLVNGEKKVMIVGRFQQSSKSKKVFDYSAVLWPEGYIDANHVYLFDHKDIDTTFFIGYQSDEEKAMMEILEKEYEKL